MKDTKSKIFQSAKHMFYEKGYHSSTVMEITNEAGANSGLFNYYFKNKFNVGLLIYRDMFDRIMNLTNRYISMEDHPALFMGVMMRIHTYTITYEKVVKFTIDAMEESILEESVLVNAKPLMLKIAEFYNLDLTEEDLHLRLAVILATEKAVLKQNHLGRIHMELKEMVDYFLFKHLEGFGLEQKEIDWCIKEVVSVFSKLRSDYPHFEAMITD